MKQWQDVTLYFPTFKDCKSTLETKTFIKSKQVKTMQLSISTEDIKVSDKKLLYLLGLAGRVNFLHSSWYGTVIRIRAENCG